MDMDTPAPNQNQIKARTVTTHELVHAISRLKWLLLTGLVLIGCLAFWYSKTRILKYSASATFYINDINSVSLTSPNNETKPLDALLTGENFNRVYQLISSTRTHNYLIHKFGLIQHYRIDSTREFSYERTLNRLKANIEVKKSPFNMVTVTVSDEYRYKAAEMANDIISFVDKLNKNMLLESVQRKINIYKGLILEINKMNQARKNEIDALLREINSTLINIENKKQNGAMLMEQQQRLSGMISEIEAANTELTRIQRYHTLALQILKEKNLPTIILMQYATPYSYSLAPKALGMSLLVVAFFFTLFVLFLYWKLRYGNYVSLFLKS